MPTARRRGILAVVTATVLLALGLGVGVVVGDAIGIRTEPSTQMTPADPVVPAVSGPVSAPAFTVIDAHSQNAVRAGASEAELAETAWVATAIRAGGGYAHGRLAFKLADGLVHQH